MATVYATKTGNWSDTTVWSTSALPTSSDDVYADGKTVTIDQNVTVLSLRTTQRSGGTAGGGFAVSGAYTVTASGNGIVAGTTTCLTTSNAVGTTVTVVATVSGGSSGSAYGMFITGAGPVDLTGAVSGGSGSTAHGISISGAATITVTGNVTGGTGTQSSGIRNTAGTTLTVNGTVTPNSSGTTSYGIWVGTANMTLSVTGAVTGGSTTGGTVNSPAIQIDPAGCTVSVVGTLTANPSSAVICSSSTVNSSVTGVLTVTGPFLSNTTVGYQPFVWAGAVKLSPISNNEYKFKHATSGTSSLYSSDVNSGAPVATDVRNGTSYGGGVLTGTLKVPSPAYVAAGVQTDATVGTYNPAADVWAYATSGATVVGSIGERLKNAATVDSTGAQLASYGS